MSIIDIAHVEDESIYGGKAVQLGAAMRVGLRVPEGYALSYALLDQVAAAEPRALQQLADVYNDFDGPLAVRSSAVGEDSATASFAGQHLTCLNVCSLPAFIDAVRAIWESARGDAAIAYRRRMGLPVTPRIAAVVQTLVHSETAGVLFTRNPIDGSDERIIEAAWGLGEAVVAGLVTPDRFRLSPSGAVLERSPGLKDIKVTIHPDGGTREETVKQPCIDALCLDDAQLLELHNLASRCQAAFGPAQDIEWAFSGDLDLYLLQHRPVTRLAA